VFDVTDARYNHEVKKNKDFIKTGIFFLFYSAVCSLNKVNIQKQTFEF